MNIGQWVSLGIIVASLVIHFVLFPATKPTPAEWQFSGVLTLICISINVLNISARWNG